MKQEIDTYFSNDEIRKLAKKVVSVRSLDYDVFVKHVKNLMEECYQKGHDDGRNDEAERWTNDYYTDYPL